MVEEMQIYMSFTYIISDILSPNHASMELGRLVCALEGHPDTSLPSLKAPAPAQRLKAPEMPAKRRVVLENP